MPASTKPFALPFAALVAAFSAALGFISGMALYGSRVAVLEAQQGTFYTDVHEMRGELQAMRADIQTLTLRLPPKNVAEMDTVKALSAQPVGLVAGLPNGSPKHHGTRQPASCLPESGWCDAWGRGRKRYAQRGNKGRKLRQRHAA